jgi:hypothetical protein
MRINSLMSTPMSEIETAKPPEPGTPREGRGSDSPEQAPAANAPTQAKLPQHPLDDPMMKALLLQKLNVPGLGSGGAIPSTRLEQNNPLDDRDGGAISAGGDGDSGSSSSSGAGDASSSSSSTGDGSTTNAGADASSQSSNNPVKDATDGTTEESANNENVCRGDKDGQTQQSSSTVEANTSPNVSVTSTTTTEASTDNSKASSQSGQENNTASTNATEITFSEDEAEPITGDPNAFNPLANTTSAQVDQGPQLSATTPEQMKVDGEYTKEAEQYEQEVEQWLDVSQDLRSHPIHREVEVEAIMPTTTSRVIP